MNYLKKFFDKMFYLAISFKVQITFIMIVISTWLCYLEKINGTNLAAIWTVLISTVLVSREFAKKNFNSTIEDVTGIDLGEE